MARERPSTYLHTNTQPRGFGWRIHCGVEVTELSTNKQHTLSLSYKDTLENTPSPRAAQAPCANRTDNLVVNFDRSGFEHYNWRRGEGSCQLARSKLSFSHTLFL